MRQQGWLRGRAGVRAGLLAVAAGAGAFVAAIALSLQVPAVFESLRVPLAGIGLGVQLAVLLPPAGALRAVARFAVPVAVDLASALAVDGVGVAGGLPAVPGWLALALLLVGLLEWPGRLSRPA